ncbi:60S ribosomal protein L6-like protein [Dinothrombium tinctorium]|uniref:Large ribosomal subunit protein eL6 n=1 Tax=Dinothrombium tinctorium TaxID=1965070 RepID=A0A3S3NZK2_9ACAR|nr:60S ribosomal protein L6-like protein [Dinothrombium tinctorium]
MSKAKAKKAPAQATTTPAAAKKEKKLMPKNVRKILTHRRIRPMWAKIKRTAKKKGVAPETLLKKKPKFVVKPISGEKNGSKRLVRVKKERKFYPTEDRPRRVRTGHITFRQHKRHYKQGIEPGRVVIILSGRHKGKRVVVLKTMPSGLLLVTGPMKINSCPLRRMHQMFTIVTSTKLDISGVKVPDHIDDKYFKRKHNSSKKAKSKRGDGGDIFDTKPEAYKPDEQRKKDQIEIDTQVIDVIRKHPEKKLMFSYLGSYFQLRNHMYPHLMKF